jgi:MFS family permease
VVEERTGQVPEESHVTLIFSLAVSLYCVGGMLGGCITGLIADKFGRKVKISPHFSKYATCVTSVFSKLHLKIPAVILLEKF